MVCEQLIENLVEKPKPPIRQPKPETLNLAINCNPSRFVETAVASVWLGATVGLVIYVLVIATLGSCRDFRC